MKHVDFLPRAFHEVQRRRLRTRHNIMCCLAACAAMLTIHVTAQSGIRNAEASLTELRSTRDKQSIQQRISQLQQNHATLHQQLAMVDRLDNGARMGSILEEITRYADAPMRVLSLQIDQRRTGTAPQVVLGGLAAGDLDIGMLCGRLSSCPLFEAAAVSGLKQTPTGQSPGRQFEIRCTLRPAARPSPEEH